MTLNKELEQLVTSKLCQKFVPLGFKQVKKGDNILCRKRQLGVIEHIHLPMVHYPNKGLSLVCGASIRFDEVENALVELASDPTYWDPSCIEKANPRATIGTTLEQLIAPSQPVRGWGIFSVEEAESCANHLIDGIERLAIPWLEKNSTLSNAYEWLLKRIASERFPQHSSILWFQAYLMAEMLGVTQDPVIFSSIKKLAESEERGHNVARKVIVKSVQALS